MHPVAQRLTVHPGLIRRLGPGVAVKNERQGEQTAYLRTVTAFGCDRAKVVRGVFGSCNGERFAHWMLQRPESGLGGIESNSRTDSQPPGESRFRTPGITPGTPLSWPRSLVIALKRRSTMDPPGLARLHGLLSRWCETATRFRCSWLQPRLSFRAKKFISARRRRNPAGLSSCVHSDEFG